MYFVRLLVAMMAFSDLVLVGGDVGFGVGQIDRQTKRQTDRKDRQTKRRWRGQRKIVAKRFRFDSGTPRKL